MHLKNMVSRILTGHPRRENLREALERLIEESDKAVVTKNALRRILADTASEEPGLKPGTRVRLNDHAKRSLRGKCGAAGKHLGPFDPDDDYPRECLGCSTAHVDEFGDSVGTVEGLVNYNNPPEEDPSKIGPELNVRWDSGLRYGYPKDFLEIVVS